MELNVRHEVDAGAPPDAIRTQFARRLQAALLDKGWNQAELARRMGPLLRNRRLGRDNISKYVRGKVLPTPLALDAMAKVLGVKPTDLLPVRASSTERPPQLYRGLEADHTMCWVQINLALPWAKAMAIQGIISGSEP
jgi:transcriptional regulator with XRE-family HTH domain